VTDRRAGRPNILSQFAPIADIWRTKAVVRKVPGSDIALEGQCQNSIMRRFFYTATIDTLVMLVAPGMPGEVWTKLIYFPPLAPPSSNARAYEDPS
jgi:hypothetical protein